MIYLNGKPLNVTMFPDNTSQVWKLPDYIINETNWVNIAWEFQHEGEFMHIAQLKELLDGYQIKSALRIKYLPYGRQDKEHSNDTTFALFTFANLLNSLEFSEITILDPHSSLAIKAIRNSRAEYPAKIVCKIVEMLKPDLFCYPDKGALHKYSEIFLIKNYVYGDKVRDQSTGKIIEYNLVGDVKDKKILIVDDICDGGMTFKILTENLLQNGAIEVNLFVTHGIFSNGLKTLYESGINRIFTKDGEASEVQQNIVYRGL